MSGGAAKAAAACVLALAVLVLARWAYGSFVSVERVVNSAVLEAHTEDAIDECRSQVQLLGGLLALFIRGKSYGFDAGSSELFGESRSDSRAIWRRAEDEEGRVTDVQLMRFDAYRTGGGVAAYRMCDEDRSVLLRDLSHVDKAEWTRERLVDGLCGGDTSCDEYGRDRLGVGFRGGVVVVYFSDGIVDRIDLL